MPCLGSEISGFTIQRMLITTGNGAPGGRCRIITDTEECHVGDSVTCVLEHLPLAATGRAEVMLFYQYKAALELSV